MQNYKELKVWEKAHHFAVKVYEVSKFFQKDELYSLTNQLRRAVVSVAANIAEGCGKNSQSEFAHFLNTSLGSANEAEYFLLLSKDLNYLDIDNYSKLSEMINEINAMLIALINKVRVASKT
jgi:four helix bundle protein